MDGAGWGGMVRDPALALSAISIATSPMPSFGFASWGQTERICYVPGRRTLSVRPVMSQANNKCTILIPRTSGGQVRFSGDGPPRTPHGPNDLPGTNLCPPDVRSMSALHPLCVRSASVLRPVCVRCVRPVPSLCPCCIRSASALCVRALRPLYVRSVPDLCALCVRSVPSLCPLCVRSLSALRPLRTVDIMDDAILSDVMSLPIAAPIAAPTCCPPPANRPSALQTGSFR